MLLTRDLVESSAHVSCSMLLKATVVWKFVMNELIIIIINKIINPPFWLLVNLLLSTRNWQTARLFWSGSYHCRSQHLNTLLLQNLHLKLLLKIYRASVWEYLSGMSYFWQIRQECQSLKSLSPLDQCPLKMPLRFPR